MRKLLLASMGVVLVGCATGRAPELASYDGITYGRNAAGHETVASVTFQYPGTSVPKRDSLPVCVARIVNNGSVNLSDSSRTWVGPYTGRYYKAGTERESGGEDVLQYVSDDKQEVVARGSVAYRDTSGLLPIDHAVRFTLTAKVSNPGRTFAFERLERAQLDTGFAANDGFAPLGAWAGAASPHLAIEKLKGLADELNACLSQ